MLGQDPGQRVDETTSDLLLPCHYPIDIFGSFSPPSRHWSQVTVIDPQSRPVGNFIFHDASVIVKDLLFHLVIAIVDLTVIFAARLLSSHGRCSINVAGIAVPPRFLPSYLSALSSGSSMAIYSL